MDTTLDTPALVRDLVRRVAGKPRLYDEVMEAWRAARLRLMIREGAVDAVYARAGFEPAGRGKTVPVTQADRAFAGEQGCSA